MTDLYNYVVTNYYTAEFLDHCFLPEVKDNEDDIFTTKSYYSPWVVKQEYNSENEFVKHYGNPLAMVKMSRRTIVVTKKDNKVSIKVFEYDRIRRAGKKFFKIQTNVNYITFNTLTNNLYTGSITNYHKKRKFTKRVRQNSFYEDPISKFSSIILNCTNQNFVVKNDVLKTFFDNIPLSKKYQRYDGIKRLHKLYLDHNKIKTPNNWDVFTLSYPQPKKIDYKKSKLKYIDTFMKLYELKGNKVKKALHNIETFQGVSFIKNLINVYGYDTIMSQDDNFIKNCLQYFSYGVSANIESLSKKEKLNSLEIIKSYLFNDKINLHTFNDHINMVRRLNMFEPFIWKSTDYESFQKEHLELTEKISQYTSGDYYRIYSDKFINFLEKEINVNGDTYYPVVLTNSSEYNEESFIQSNCVKTYVGRPASIIISLRKDSKDSKERASIEFLPMKNIFDEIKFKRVQTLGRFNKLLDGYWVSPIKILDDRFLELKNFDLPELIVKFKGNEIKSKSEFNDSGVLKWVNESVHHINHNGLDLPLPHIQIYDLLDENLLLDF